MTADPTYILPRSILHRHNTGAHCSDMFISSHHPNDEIFDTLCRVVGSGINAASKFLARGKRRNDSA